VEGVQQTVDRPWKVISNTLMKKWVYKFSLVFTIGMFINVITCI
jgi:hypothetical protein